MCLRVDAVYRIGEAFQTVHEGNQDILKTTAFQLRQYIKLKYRAFIFCQLHAQQFFLNVCIDAQCKEHRL